MGSMPVMRCAVNAPSVSDFKLMGVAANDVIVISRKIPKAMNFFIVNCE